MTEKIGEQIKKWRQELGLSLREMAEGAGMDYGHLWKIEQGKVIPRKRTISALQNVVKSHRQQTMIKNIMFNDWVAPTKPESTEDTTKTSYTDHKTNTKVRLTQRMVKVVNHAGENYPAAAAAISTFLDMVEKTDIDEDTALDLLIEGYYKYLSEKNQG
jgi:transcriptional regulator with XRE-family HTH domain